MSTQIPADYLYTKDHEWVKIEGSTATVGITDFAQSSLGDIVFLELPEVGTELEENATFGVVESIKSVSDIYSPVKGKVSSVNSGLLDTPEKCNEEPYESWLVKIKIDSDADHKLMSAEEYTEFVQQSH